MDPGKSGWYAIIDLKWKIIEYGKIPVIWKSKKEYDILWLKNIFKKYKYNLISIELPGTIFWIWKSSMMDLWKGIWLLQWMAFMTNYRVINIKPKKWQKIMWRDVPKIYKKSKEWKKQNDTKATSLLAARNLYPNDYFLATPRSKVPHDWIVDALLIARYWLYEHNLWL